MSNREQIAINLGWIKYLDSDGLVQYAPPEVFEEDYSDYQSLSEIDNDDDLPF